MSGKRRIFKLAVPLALVCGMWAATQFVAWKVHYSPALGVNLWGIYPPWSVVLWALEANGQAPKLFSGAASLGGAVAAVILLL